jgi:two-component system, cell cycle sensor histidine kinase PleC
VVNLLANAIKFAPGGEVVLSAAMTDAEGIEIRVADTGCGIPADQLERVFLPFHQVENAFSRTATGTGLGLPLSRKLVERHGGMLRLESAVGRGTVAILRLPGRAAPLHGLWDEPVASA